MFDAFHSHVSCRLTVLCEANTSIPVPLFSMRLVGIGRSTLDKMLSGVRPASFVASASFQQSKQRSTATMASVLLGVVEICAVRSRNG